MSRNDEKTILYVCVYRTSVICKATLEHEAYQCMWLQLDVEDN